MNYKPLKGLRGIQMQADFTRFQFSWDSAGNDSRVHFIWIYKEDELNNPRMFSYAQCIDNRIQVAFQYNNIPMQEIRKIRFLVFLSEDQRAPSREDLASLYQDSGYICEVCCGTGEVKWRWLQEPAGMTLFMNSNKKIPENILYYEYRYVNKTFQFEIPGEINYGENSYKGIYFPALQEPPVLKSREPNIMLSVGKEKPRSRGIFEKFADMFRK